MSKKTLQENIEKLIPVSNEEVSSSILEAQDIATDVADPMVDEPIDYSNEQISELMEEAEKPIESDTEPYDVVGIGGEFLKNIGKVSDEGGVKTFADAVPKAKVVVEDGKEIINFAKTSEEEANFFRQVLSADPIGPEDVGAISLKLPNFDDIKDIESLARFKQAFELDFDQSAYKGNKAVVSMDDLFARASEIGNERMMIEILELPKGKQFDDPAKVLLSNALNAKMLIRTKQLAQAIVDNKPLVDTGNFKNDMIATKLKYSEHIEIFKIVNENVTENNSNIGRSLQVLGKIRNYFSQSETFASEAGVVALKDFPGIDADGYMRHAQQFLTLEKKAQSGYLSRSPNLLDKIRYGADVFTELRLSSLLSSFRTDARNTFGTGAFTLYTNVVDPASAATVGKLRKVLFKGDPKGSNQDSWINRMATPDQIKYAEVAYRVAGMRHAMDEAYSSLYSIIKTGKVSDINTKYDTRTIEAISKKEFEKKFPDLAGTGVGKAMDNWGKLVRAKGRLLLGTDEFFKVINFRAELYGQAFRKRDEILQAGGSKADADRAGMKVLVSPNQAQMDAAVEAARVNTFTNDLGGFLGQLQGPMSHPIAKLVVPFYRTPVNLVGRAAERSPLALTMPKFYADVSAGGAKFDYAVGKMATGTAILTGIAMKATGLYDKDFVCTGAFPETENDKRIWKQQKIPPYSCGFKNPDTGNYEFVSYKSFEPLSGVLAMGSTIGHLLKNTPTDTTTVEFGYDLIQAGSYAMYDHVNTLPFLDPLADFDRVFDKRDHQSRMRALAEYLGQTTSESILQAGQGALGFPFGSGFLADLERAIDPRQSNISADDSKSGYTYGFARGINSVRSRIPGLSGDLPTNLNFWGEEVLPGGGKNSLAWELFSPLAIRNTKFNDINFFFQTYTKADLPFHKKSIDGIPLNSRQSDEFITIINTVTDKNGLTMKERFLYEIYNDAGHQYHPLHQRYDKEKRVYRETTPKEKLSHMQTIYGIFRDKAKLLVLEQYPELTDRANKRNEYLEQNPLSGTTKGQY
tara:strand:+ start:5002 stop:8091 length:3090 start_codon:yes stop_codon:yes gene_type:complete